MKNFKDVLIRLQACYEAMEWAGDKTLQEIWETCERGDWMLWLLRRSDLFKTYHRKFTMAKWVCANQVRHLMTDKRSLNALDVAYKYAIGEASNEELETSANAAYVAAAAINATASAINAAACAADAAACTADAAAGSAGVSYAADASDAAACAADATDVARFNARFKMRSICADEIRKVINWNEITFDL